MVTNEQIIKALYENRKLTITMNYKIYGEKIGFSPSYIYAIANDIFPFFHNEGDEDPFVSCYKITSDEINQVINYIDEEWLKGELYSFYDLETKFGGKSYRSELIRILRYTYLDDRFDTALWEKLVSWAPVEANNLNRPLDDWEI